MRLGETELTGWATTQGRGARDLLRTTVSSRTYSVYTRTQFQLSDLSDLTGVYFGADYDDGVVAWLNGVEIFRTPNMPAGAPDWNTNTTAQEESSERAAPNYQPMADVTDSALNALRDGENLLAIGVWNFNAPSSSDLVLAPVFVTQERVPLEWETRLNFEREGRAVRELDDGQFVVAGVLGPSSDQQEGYLARFDNKGELLWESTVGGDDDRWFDVLEVTSDGGFVAAGGRAADAFTVPSDVLVVSFDDQGSVRWEASFGNDERENADSLRVTEDTILLSGHCVAAEVGCQAFVIEMSHEGRLIRRDDFGLERSATSTQLTRDGGLAVVHPGGDVSRLNSAGEILWTSNVTRSFGVRPTIRETLDGGFVLAGRAGGESVEVAPRVLFVFWWRRRDEATRRGRKAAME